MHVLPFQSIAIIRNKESPGTLFPLHGSLSPRLDAFRSPNCPPPRNCHQEGLRMHLMNEWQREAAPAPNQQSSPPWSVWAGGRAPPGLCGALRHPEPTGKKQAPVDHGESSPLSPLHTLTSDTVFTLQLTGSSLRTYRQAVNYTDRQTKNARKSQDLELPLGRPLADKPWTTVFGS